VEEFEYLGEVYYSAAKEDVVASSSGVAQMDVEYTVLQGVHGSLWAYGHQIDMGEVDGCSDVFGVHGFKDFNYFWSCFAEFLLSSHVLEGE